MQIIRLVVSITILILSTIYEIAFGFEIVESMLYFLTIKLRI